MKTALYLLTTFTLLLFSCGQNRTSSNEFADFDYDTEAFLEQDITPDEFKDSKYKHTANESSKLKGYKVMSKQFNMPVGIMPIPINWEILNNNKEGILFQSKDNVKVYKERFISYFFSNNQQLNYMNQQSGRPVAPPKNINQIIQEDIVPNVKAQGLKLVNQFALPKLAQFDKHFDSYLFKGIPENKQFQCVATEWINNKGEKSIGIIRYFTNQYTTIGGMDWGYTLNIMEAPANIYENAKKYFINSLVNFQINPQWVQTSNSYYSQKSRQSTANHQKRMAAINAQGQTIRNIGNTYSSISDSNFESWKRRNDMNSAGHSNSINNGIWERTTVSNPNSGQQYYVEGQNNYYWMNQNNEYVETDNSLYNPNIDNSMNNQNWTQYNIEN
ncbi:hypothetical protein [Hyunsoonleella pacifica]|uniref:Lipoprotein n=1 Tax=Hyunsoonleella pacifica TaxID=1080224 RepID=A0A4Q9FMF3_9FLAO|nr:hypothetical protein [Hyunsoonleella pacifica]TBN15508.1 hypothetical protein EYD46_10255 [Hyunsoonleella pacifica]GGD24656.1 hypothetical protein GCM10011368_28410 [Hyunsoonleella pacifica]